MDPVKRYLLQNVDIPDEAWEEIQQGLNHRMLQRKQLFLKQGQFCREIGFILKGYVRLYYLKDGIEITKDFNFENGFCGSWASFSLEQPSLFNIVAMEDTDMVCFSKQHLYAWF